MALLTERTTFTLDVLGRYTANTWQEVIDSQNQALDPHARPFDVFIIGGGTFGPALASRLFSTDHTRARRILLIEAGPLALLGLLAAALPPRGDPDPALAGHHSRRPAPACADDPRRHPHRRATAVLLGPRRRADRSSGPQRLHLRRAARGHADPAVHRPHRPSRR